MVHQVRLVEAFQVAIPGHVTHRPALVHQTVVGKEIQKTVSRHACADPLQRMHALIAKGDEHDGEQREDHGVQVILFEPAVTGLMVRTMPAPPPAVHDVLVRDEGKSFHADQRGQKHQSVNHHSNHL